MSPPLFFFSFVFCFFPCLFLWNVKKKKNDKGGTSREEGKRAGDLKKHSCVAWRFKKGGMTAGEKGGGPGVPGGGGEGGREDVEM